MSFGTTTGAGPGNTKAPSESAQFYAASAVTKGQLCALATGDGTASYEVAPADSDAAGTSFVVGVALESASAGDWFDVCTGGYCAYILTDGTVTAGAHLVPHSVAGEASVMAAGEEHLVFGYALSADTGTTEYCDGLIIKRY